MSSKSTKIMRMDRTWKEKVNELVENDGFPAQWVSEGNLADYIQAIDPFLLLATPARLHQLLGRRKNGRWVLPLSTAQKYMLNQRWENEKKRRLQEVFGDNIKRLGKKALMQLERGIDEMNVTCIQMALEMAGIWQKGYKVTHIDGKKVAEELADIWNRWKKFGNEDVRAKKGNN